MPSFTVHLNGARALPASAHSPSGAAAYDYDAGAFPGLPGLPVLTGASRQSPESISSAWGSLSGPGTPDSDYDTQSAVPGTPDSDYDAQSAASSHGLPLGAPPSTHTVPPSPTPSSVAADRLTDALDAMDMSTDHGSPETTAASAVDAAVFEPQAAPQAAPQEDLEVVYWRNAAAHWYNMCLEMQRHVSQICVPLDGPDTGS